MPAIHTRFKFHGKDRSRMQNVIKVLQQILARNAKIPSALILTDEQAADAAVIINQMRANLARLVDI